MKIAVIGLGAGGHAKVVMEALNGQAGYEIVGLLDPDPRLKGQIILGVPVLGGDDLLPELVLKGVRHFFVGVGTVGKANPRRRLFTAGQQMGLAAVDVIHKSAIVSPSAILGEGITILAGAIVNAQAQIGVNVVINTGVIVEHDCIVGDHVHLATGARLCGGVQVGAEAHIGAGAVVRQGINIGEQAVVGAGAVVVKDVPPSVVVAGVPAQVLRQRL